MKIGLLNEFFAKMELSWHFEGSTLVPQAEVMGNPLRSEPLHFNWNVLRDRGLALEIPLPEACYVDTVQLQFGPKTALTYAKLYSGEQLLYTYRAETGKSAKDRTLSLEANAVCQQLRIVLCADFQHVQLEGISLSCALEDGVDLFPTANKVSLSGASVSVSCFTGCSWDSSDAQQAAAILREKFLERTGIQLEANGNIRFCSDPSLGENGYTLEVTDLGATVRAADLRGFVSGAETLIKLIKDGCVPAVTVEDSPFKAFRGVHLFIPSEAQMPFAKRLIKYLISPMGYNTVILQVSGGMIYEKHPKISEAFAHAVQMREKGWPAFPHCGIAEGKPITKALLKEYIAYIRSFGIDVIPEVQSLAHVQYLTNAYPEIAERAEDAEAQKVDTRIEDMLPSQFYKHDYCPSNPRSYEILFDVIDEIIEVFQPREFVHMGHDEVRTIAACPLCRQKTPTQLFVEDVCKIHDYLAKKGLKMMMWADMLQPFPKYPTVGAIDLLPKDIVLLDFIWYFHMDKDIEENLLEKGFDVLIGNLYSSHFPRYESRIRKPGIGGGQISAWVATNEQELQKEGKLYDMLMTAQLLWAESYQALHLLTYDRLIRAMLPQLRDDLRATVAPSRRPGARIVPLAQNTKAAPKSAFPVQGSYASLIFRHTALEKYTKLPWTELEVVARYVIRYENGATEEIPVTYGGNIGYHNRWQNAPLRNPVYRHNGYTATYTCDSETVLNAQGEPETLYVYEHILQQQSPVVSITLEQEPAFDARVYTDSIQGVQQ